MNIVYKDAKLSDGNTYKFRKVNIMGKDIPDKIQASLMFLKRSSEGADYNNLMKKLASAERTAARLETMAKRAEAFMDHPETTMEKREEYFRKLEVFLVERDKALTERDNEETAYGELAQKIADMAVDVAVWALSSEPNNVDPEYAIDFITNDDALYVMRILLGAPIPKQDANGKDIESEEVPVELHPTVTSVAG